MSQFRVLTVGNPKIQKGIKFGYLTAVLHFAPAKLSGWEVCPNRTKGCTLACLNTAGRGGIKAGHGILTHADVAAGTVNAIQAARIRKTRRYFEDRPSFMVDLVKDIAALVRMAKRHGLKPAIRLNGTSDIPWERVPVTALDGSKDVNVMRLFPNVQFYDYTKRANRKSLPSNYALTYSLAEDNDAQAIVALRNGMNVAAVFHKVPAKLGAFVNLDGTTKLIAADASMSWEVIDGDAHDLRFMDKRGVIVGLKAKGNAKKDTSGFVR